MTKLNNAIPFDPAARARRTLAAMLRDLGIGTEGLDVERDRDALRVALDCQAGGAPARIMLELDPAAVEAVHAHPELHEALLIELDEYLCECERRTTAEQRAL